MEHPASITKLYERGADGYPVGADDVLRSACGPIPDAEHFQDGSTMQTVKPTTIHGWQWSETFRRWGAVVTLPSGWTGLTWPVPTRIASGDQ